MWSRTRRGTSNVQNVSKATVAHAGRASVELLDGDLTKGNIGGEVVFSNFDGMHRYATHIALYLVKEYLYERVIVGYNCTQNTSMTQWENFNEQKYLAANRPDPTGFKNAEQTSTWDHIEFPVH